ncbi:MAG: alpha/beta fold hydrolase [Pseudomonadales bacterium]
MKLHFKQTGRGEPIILLHGLFGSASNLGGVARALATNFSVYSVDLRNHGKSPHTEQMDYSSMADDVLQLIDDQTLSPAHLLGHSMGGKTAMQLALNYPQHVGKLIVADIAPVTYQHAHTNVLQGLTAVAETRVSSRQQADDILAQHVSEAGVRGFLLKSLTRKPQGDYTWQLNLDAIEVNYDELAKGNSGEPFTGDTLFIKGDQSDYILPEHKDAVLALFPNAQVRVIANAGHWLHAEQPETFNNIVERFLNV